MKKPKVWQVWDSDKRMPLTIGAYALCQHVLNQQDKQKVKNRTISIKPFDV